MLFFMVSCGGATPGAELTPRKRGPWRPHRMGRQGRLPNWKASPRREILGYLQQPYMYVLDTLVDLSLGTVRLTLAK